MNIETAQDLDEDHVIEVIDEEGPLNGYQLIKTLDVPEGFSEGTIYPFLERLRRQGKITTHKDDGRTLFSTP